MPENPPSMQRGARSPGRAPDDFAYACEVCGTVVELDLRKVRMLKYGIVVRCSAHPLLTRRRRLRRPRPLRRAHPQERPAALDHNPEAVRTAKPRRRPRSSPPRDRYGFGLTPAQRRDEGGVTVTIQRDDGKLRTLVGEGPVLKALRAVAEDIDRLNGLDPRGGWKVASVSTPRTIYADLQGMRDELAQSPERLLLGRIHRLDLLRQGRPELQDPEGGPVQASYGTGVRQKRPLPTLYRHGWTTRRRVRGDN